MENNKKLLTEEYIALMGFEEARANGVRKSFAEKDIVDIEIILANAKNRRFKQNQEREQAEKREKEMKAFFDAEYVDKELKTERLDMYNYLREVRLDFLERNDMSRAIIPEAQRDRIFYLLQAEGTRDIMEDGLGDLIREALKVPNKRIGDKKPNENISKEADRILRKLIKEDPTRVPANFWSVMVGNEFRQGRVTKKALRILIDFNEELKFPLLFMLGKWLKPELESEHAQCRKLEEIENPTDYDERMIEKHLVRINLLEKVIEIYDDHLLKYRQGMCLGEVVG